MTIFHSAVKRCIETLLFTVDKIKISVSKGSNKSFKRIKELTFSMSLINTIKTRNGKNMGQKREEGKNAPQFYFMNSTALLRLPPFQTLLGGEHETVFMLVID